MKHIVIIGGGTGTYTLLSGLKKYPVKLSVIVSTADDGGSTGVLRKELGVFPPGDIRQCLLGLSSADQATKDLFAYRFDSGKLKGHNLGNLIIAGLEKITGSISKAIAEAGEMLKVKGDVIPATTKPTTLIATLENGKKIVGEHNIDEPAKPRELRIKNLELRGSVKANPSAIRAIKNADVIVFGPGDLYTSILPNLLAGGMVKAITASRAKKILVTNIMTKAGQTDGFTVADFIRVTKQYIGPAKIDMVVANSKKPSAKWLKAYKKERAEFIEPSFANIGRTKIATADLISEFVFKRTSGDKLKRSFLRHDSNKLAKIIYELSK